MCGHANAKDHINTVLKTNATLLTQAPCGLYNVPLAPSRLRTLSSDSRAQLVELVRRAAPVGLECLEIAAFEIGLAIRQHNIKGE